MEKIIYMLAGLVAGVFGGYGYGKTKNIPINLYLSSTKRIYSFNLKIKL